MYIFRMDPTVYNDLQNHGHVIAKSSKEIFRALDHIDPLVRKAALHSPHFGPEHLTKALSDKYLFVKLQAKVIAKERGWWL